MNYSYGLFVMNILLIANDINQETVNELATPFGLMYISSYLKKHIGEKVKVKIIDGNIDYEDDNFKSIIDESHIIGISSMTRYYKKACDLASEIKSKFKKPIILGGHHITSLPHTLDESFDAGVIGEGEDSFLEIVRLLLEKKSFYRDDLIKIKGLVMRENGKTILNQERKEYPLLDDIPFPDRELWDLHDRAKYILSSRGCPFQCVFCAIAGSKYRFPSTEYVLNELEIICRDYHPQILIFQDDLFTVSEERVKRISEGVISMGLHKKTAFIVSLRADCLSLEVVKNLKNMNVFKVFMGIESGSEEIIKYYKAGRITINDVEKALLLCRKYDLKVEGSFIIGAPRETPDDLLKTYNFIFNNYRDGLLDGASINILTPFPGSRVWEYAKKRGIVTDDMDWSRFNMTINIFDPYTCLYLSEVIPLVEFIDYLEYFEELHFSINRKLYKTLGKSYEKLFFESRLDKNLLKRFKAGYPAE